MIAPYVTSGAEALGNRLRKGYNELVGGKDSGGGSFNDQRMHDGIERAKYM